MSKGGAGKVYFVLYLAVILELLIIFIERDEAEEHLRREQKQAIEIVQTILSQLQTGSGTTGITVSPKDNIVLDDKTPANNMRNYDVDVSVGDAKATLVVAGKTMRGDDVGLLEYIVSHTPNPDRPVEDLGEDTTDIEGGEKIFAANLGTEIGSYDQPRQVFGAGIPADNPSNYFYLNDTLTAKKIAQSHRVKVFSVNFKPNRGAGWYRLRFASQTNKILGISGGKPSPTDTIRIGNVKLTVKQLTQVQKALLRERGAAGDKTQVEKYIETLLTPDAYKKLTENMGYQSFNVRVTKPPAPKAQDPVAEILMQRDTAYWYDVAPFSVVVRLGPAEGAKDMSGGARLVALDPATNRYTAFIDKPSEGMIPLVAKASNAGKVDVSEKTLQVFKPALKGGIEKWRGMKATVSRKYNPSTDWVATQIPEDHYQTIVEIKGREVFNRAGTVFKDAELPADLLVSEQTTQPTDIKLTVFWKPGGNSDRTTWVPLMSNQQAAEVIIKPSKAFAISYPAPTHDEGFEFTWVISPKKMSNTMGPIILRQKIGDGRNVPVTDATVSCAECAEYGLAARLIPDGENWSVVMEVADRTKLKKTVDGHRFDLGIEMKGRGGAAGTGGVNVTTKVGK
ncbi:MAG: hypothetical protein H7X80_04685 [bacterium]|nr:hypothetical protein [Candidatus Kapabacteria bacterium]